MGPVCAASILILLASTASPGPPAAADPAPLWGLTTPAERATLSIPATGRLGQVLVEEGASVQAGTLLAVLEDGAQQARVRSAQVRSESTVDTELAQVRLRLARDELDRVRELSTDASASLLERQRAEAELASAELHLKACELEREVSQQDFAFQSHVLEQMQLRAPFSGYVSRLCRRVGESVEVSDAVIELAQLDPLLVELDCPVELGQSLALGDSATIRPVDRGRESRTGVVVFISKVADAASQTQRCRLRVPNADLGWIAGLSVTVEFAGPARPDGP